MRMGPSVQLINVYSALTNSIVQVKREWINEKSKTHCNLGTGGLGVGPLWLYTSHPSNPPIKWSPRLAAFNFFVPK